MNRTILLLVVSFMASSLFAQKEVATTNTKSSQTLVTKNATPSNVKGIAFQNLPFADALKMAQKQKKLIFLDAYTSWCGPCKMLDKGPFKDETVGEFFNQNFINLKKDMEQGEGTSIAQKYRVSAYPTLLFIDGKGEVRHVSLGYKTSPELIAEGKKALALFK